MITVVCTYLNPKTMMPMNNLEKIFMDLGEYSKFYNMAKSDPYVVLSVMNYDSKSNPSLHEKYSMILLSLPRGLPI